MTGPTIDERTAAIRELVDVADDFAERARMQESRRDRARPGTGPHHQHAHSATLWRLAEQRLRDRIIELEVASAAFVDLAFNAQVQAVDASLVPSPPS